MSNNQIILYEGQIAEDLRAYITNRSKEQELVEALCKSPTLYEKFFNKKAYELRQELVRQDLQMLRRHSAKAMELHFALYQSSHETIAEVYLRKLKANGQAYLAEEYKRLKDEAIRRNRESMRRDAEEFDGMMRDAEEIYAERPNMLDRHIASIERQRESVMKANEKILDNLLDLLQERL